MASGTVLLVAAVLFARAAHASVPPKFIKAAYGVQKALYARNFGYSLVPIPTRIQVQAHPPKTLPLVGGPPVIASRQGRAYKYYRPYGPPSRRRRKRPPTKRRRPPSSYGLPVYATKYKNYVPSRRPPPPYSRYKKKRRPPYRGPPRRPPPIVDHQEFDEYEQEIPDDYGEYDHRDGDYSYFDIPSKRLPLEYDKDFLNRHADLYNNGYNPGPPRGRPKELLRQPSNHVRTRVHYHPSKEDHAVHHEKPEEESQESLWPGEVSNVHSQEKESPWREDSQPGVWSDHGDTQPASTQWHEYDRQPYPGWPSRPQRQDNQWQVYQTQGQPVAQAQLPQEIPQQQKQQRPTFQWPPRPTRAQELRGWTTSLKPKPLSAAVANPSRPVVPREQDTSNHRPVYNWDPSTNTYRMVEQESRPRYQAHYSEADFNYHNSAERKATDRSNRAFSEPDIGFGEGMEVIDDGVAGWKVKK